MGQNLEQESYFEIILVETKDFLTIVNIRLFFC